ncbi:MAG: DUF5110 domain-containing protein [Spirochaetales bacterium]|nr:DUF5110 domain-containing protein [Spirochaetales bacterium]
MQRRQLSDNITQYTIGKPLDTGAIILRSDQSADDCDRIPHFSADSDDDNNLRLSKALTDDEAIYGLGEMLGGLNKRGRKYRCYNNDDPNHTPEKQNLYGSHPFMIFDADETFGLFIDYPGEIVIDAGFDRRDTCTIELTKDVHNEVNTNIYIIEGKNKSEIIHNFLTLVGSPFMPPKWAFGYQQSRWSYPTADAVRDICRKFREYDIPCDAVYLDLDYMDDYKVFTTSHERFGDFAAFAKELLADGFHLVPIIDPGVKVEDGYAVYEEGKANNYFCKEYDYEDKKSSGDDFIAAVWPGRTAMPDFMNAQVRQWWADLYKQFCEIGVNSFWNDMNEPALFFTKRGLEDLYTTYDEVRSRTNPGLDFFDLKDKATGLSNNREDYKRFCHDCDGQTVCHDDVHNLYGFNMVRASADGLKRHSHGNRYFLLSRSSYIGSHRYGAVWTGDNQSWWEHIIVHIKMIQSMNMCGFFFVGPDIPGFGCDADAELLVRWLQVGIFTPFLRNHAALFTRSQEPWAFDDEITGIARNAIRFRYAMMPYIYSEYHNCVKFAKPFITPLSFAFSDHRCKSIEDQFMFGHSVMAAPVHSQNARGRSVTLPDCKWLAWRATDYTSREMEVFAPGTYFFDCRLDQFLLFIKEDSLFVMTSPGQNTQTRTDELTVIGLVTHSAEFTCYDDDGTTYQYEHGKYCTLRMKVTAEGSDYSVTCKYNAHDGYKNRIKRINFEIYNGKGELVRKSIKMSGDTPEAPVRR